MSIKLIKYIARYPSETIRYTPKYDRKTRKFNPEDLLRKIVLLFYERGEPVEVTAIARELGLEKVEKFTERVIKRYLGRMVDCKTKERRIFISPSALIFVFEDGKVLDLTDLAEFYNNLPKFSQKVTVNILKEEITLEELLLIFRGREQEAIKKLSELCKMAKPLLPYHDFAKYDFSTLREYIHRGFLLEDISQRIRDSRYKLGDLVLDFIRWYGTGRKGEEFSFDDV
ncbi:MAG: hypothetical protein DSO07_12280, partial [Thermoproteota archaeon]